MTERDLNREQQPRKLRLSGKFDSVERIARSDEDRMADEVREREAKQARAEQAERDAEIRRAALAALRAVDHLRTVLRGERTGTMKAIDHHARRLRGHLDALRRP